MPDTPIPVNTGGKEQAEIERLQARLDKSAVDALVWASEVDQLEARVEEITTGYNREVSDRRRIQGHWDITTRKNSELQARVKELDAVIERLGDEKAFAEKFRNWGDVYAGSELKARIQYARDNRSKSE